MNIPTFVINLETQKERREYIKNLIKDYNFDIEWIKAIDGENLSDAQLSNYFDIIKYNRQNKYCIKKSEIGCTLSHRLCYKKIIRKKLKYGLIIEDDIIFIKNIKPLLPKILNLIDVDVPTIILLSGFFFFSSKRPLTKDHYVCKVFDARLTHSYLINYKASKIILNSKPWYIADNWLQIKKMGIKIYGISPHIIDQNLNFYSSSSIRFKQTSKNKLNFIISLNSIILRIMRTIYRKLNKLESAQTIINDK